jgi:hypothetical protein
MHETVPIEQQDNSTPHFRTVPFVVRWLEAFGVLLAVFASLWAAHMNRQDSYTQMQASILNDFKKEFKSLGPARLVASDFTLRHLHEKNVPLEDIPPEVWVMMDFFDEVSMYSKRDYVDKEMTFVGFYYWMGPYYQFYKEEIKALQKENPLVMYDEIPRQLESLKLAGGHLGRTDADFAIAESDSQLAEFFRSECLETRATSASSTAKCTDSSASPVAMPTAPNPSASPSKPAKAASPGPRA